LRQNGRASNGEEFECARFIDQMDEVSRWVRNTPRQASSFWLQTYTDKFHPDFVAELSDGRILVVEYKRENDWSNDDLRRSGRWAICGPTAAAGGASSSCPRARTSGR
jgi:hypothetical protein